MQVVFASSFDRRFKKLDKSVQLKVREAIESLLACWEIKAPLRPGLGLKNFQGDYWEIRVDLRTRIIFELSDRIIFWLVGTHDDIRRFIRNV